MPPTSTESSAPTQPPDDRPFEPKWASPPGDTIKDLLIERGVPFRVFAAAMEMGRMEAALLLRGEFRINERLAMRLAGVMGSTAEFWLARDAQYLADKARLANDV